MPTNNPGKPWIQGTEMAAPADTFFVNDYPYTHSRQVDQVCLLGAAALVVAYLVLRKVAGRRLRRSLPPTVLRLRVPLLVLLFFALLEGALFVAVRLEPGLQYRPDPVAGWRVHAPWGDTGLQTNSLGLASPEISVQKPAGTLRVLCLGDSRTMGGAGAKPRLTYPAMLQRRLRELAPGRKIQVIQGAVSGYTSYQGLLLYRNLGRRLQPDLITVALGYQDGMLDWAPDKQHMSDSYALTVARGLLYKSNLFLVLRKNLMDLERRRLNRSVDQPAYPRVDLDDFRRNMTELVRLARRDRARVLFIELPHNPRFEIGHKGQDFAYAEALEQVVARHRGADVAHEDLRVFFEGRIKAARAHTRYFVDDCHMTPHGHKLLAGHLARVLLQRGLLDRVR